MGKRCICQDEIHPYYVIEEAKGRTRYIFDIPEEMLDRINRVESEFKEIQDYLESLYYSGS